MKDRLIQLIDFVTNKHRRFKELEELTGINSDSWRMFYSGKQRATEEMIEKICSVFPKVALWITTGKSQPEHEQYDAKTFSLLKIHSLHSILEKEPIEVTGDEMIVFEAESKKIDYLSEKTDFIRYLVPEIFNFRHARFLGIIKNELKMRDAKEQHQAMTEIYKKTDKSPIKP